MGWIAQAIRNPVGLAVPMGRVSVVERRRASMVYETMDLASRVSTCRSTQRVEGVLGGTWEQVDGPS